MMVAVVTALMVALTSLGVTKVNQAAFSGFNNSRVMLQAQQYAEAEAAVVKATAYSNLSARNKIEIQNSNGYFSEITLSEESDYSDDVKQRIASINIYRGAEELPRYTLEVLKTNAEVQAASGVPVGTIIAWPSSTAPTEGGTWLLCNGGSFSSSTYPKLYSVLGKTTLPSLNGRFLEGTTGTPGSTKSAGLPNITGTLLVRNNFYSGYSHAPTECSGAFKMQSKGYRSEGNADDNKDEQIYEFNASYSNSIYGASSTVQPASYTVRYYIKAL